MHPSGNNREVGHDCAFGPIGSGNHAAIHFAREILEGSATAFYEVDSDLNLNRFVLSSGIPAGFHDQHLAE